MECHGVPEYVIVSGRVCVDDGQLKAVQGYGHFVETPVNAPFIYDIENAQHLKPSHNGVNEAQLTEKLLKVALNDSSRDCATPTFSDTAISTPSGRGPRPDGQRNLQDSTFSISGKLQLSTHMLELIKLLFVFRGA